MRHISFFRYGYKNTDEVRQIVKEMHDAEIPYDVQFVDIDYMNRSAIFTFGVSLSEMK